MKIKESLSFVWEKIEQADLSLLDKISDAAVFLNEWLDLSKADCLRILAVGKLAFGIILYFGAKFYFGVFVWMLIASYDWYRAGTRTNVEIPSWSRIMWWPYVISVAMTGPWARIGLWICLELYVYLNSSKDKPSDKGRKRKEFLDKIRFKRFDPVLTT
jgi:hypothetical protein